jgi:hypothetical protein
VLRPASGRSRRRCRDSTSANTRPSWSSISAAARPKSPFFRLTGVVALHSIKVGGDTFDAAITARLRSERFAIGPLTAERLKIERGYAGRPPGRDRYSVAGIDMAAMRPTRRIVDETLVGEAMATASKSIARACWSILEQTPPDLAGDLLDDRHHADRRRRARSRVSQAS